MSCSTLDFIFEISLSIFVHKLVLLFESLCRNATFQQVMSSQRPYLFSWKVKLRVLLAYYHAPRRASFDEINCSSQSVRFYDPLVARPILRLEIKREGRQRWGVLVDFHEDYICQTKGVYFRQKPSTIGGTEPKQEISFCQKKLVSENVKPKTLESRYNVVNSLKRMSSSGRQEH